MSQNYVLPIWAFRELKYINYQISSNEVLSIAFFDLCQTHCYHDVNFMFRTTALVLSTLQINSMIPIFTS